MIGKKRTVQREGVRGEQVWISEELAELADELAPDIKIVYSAARKKTISARQEAGQVIIMAPAKMRAPELRRQVMALAQKVRRTKDPSPEGLLARAHELNKRFLEGKAQITDVQWVTNMSRRWGSCTISTKKIRLSHYLQKAPQYVQDQVLIHELVHTWISGHTDEFYAYAHRAPYYDKAQGYLEAYAQWGVHSDMEQD